MSSLTLSDEMTSSIFNQNERSSGSHLDLEPLPIDEFAKPSAHAVMMKMLSQNGTSLPETTASFVRSTFFDFTSPSMPDNTVPLPSMPTSSLLDEACNIVFGDIDNNTDDLSLGNGEDFPQKESDTNQVDLFSGNSQQWFQPETTTGSEEARSSNIRSTNNDGELTSCINDRTSAVGSSSTNNNGNIIPSCIKVKPSVVGRSWYERYHELMGFQNEYGHCCVPVHWPQNPQLAQWVKRQRSQFKLRKDGKHSNMNNARLDALEQINFVWDSHSALWEKRLGELKTFRESHGHCNVPTQYPPNQELAVWAKSQRRQFKLYCQGGETKCHISVDRIQKLLNVGFVFNPTGRDFLKSKPKKKATWW